MVAQCGCAGSVVCYQLVNSVPTLVIIQGSRAASRDKIWRMWSLKCQHSGLVLKGFSVITVPSCGVKLQWQWSHHGSVVMCVDNVTIHYQPKGSSQMIYTVGNNILANLQNNTCFTITVVSIAREHSIQRTVFIPQQSSLVPRPRPAFRRACSSRAGRASACLAANYRHQTIAGDLLLLEVLLPSASGIGPSRGAHATL